MVPGVTSNLESRRIALIHKRLISSQTTERLSNCESPPSPVCLSLSPEAIAAFLQSHWHVMIIML